MTQKLGIIMDPIESINTKKDSSFAMLLAAQKKGWQLFYMQQGSLYLENGEVFAQGQIIEVMDDPAHWYNIQSSCCMPLASLDYLLMRKDPPFDMEYIYTTYLLEYLERAGTLVVNKPSSLRDANEKLFTAQFPQCCTKTLVSSQAQALRGFITQHQDVILKPLDGMGGESIFRVTPLTPICPLF